MKKGGTRGMQTVTGLLDTVVERVEQALKELYRAIELFKLVVHKYFFFNYCHFLIFFILVLYFFRYINLYNIPNFLRK